MALEFFQSWFPVGSTPTVAPPPRQCPSWAADDHHHRPWSPDFHPRVRYIPIFSFQKKKSKFNSINFSTLKQLGQLPHPSEHRTGEIFLSITYIRKNTENHTSIASTCSDPLKSIQTAFLFFLQRIEIESEGTCSSQANKPLKLYLWVLEFFEFL